VVHKDAEKKTVAIKGGPREKASYFIGYTSLKAVSLHCGGPFRLVFRIQFHVHA
jgi:hypothetical protein